MCVCVVQLHCIHGHGRMHAQEDSDDMPVGAAWRSGREASPSHSSGEARAFAHRRRGISQTVCCVQAHVMLTERLVVVIALAAGALGRTFGLVPPTRTRPRVIW